MYWIVFFCKNIGMKYAALKAVPPLPVLAMYLIMYYLLAGVLSQCLNIFWRLKQENRYINRTIDRLPADGQLKYKPFLKYITRQFSVMNFR